MRAARERVVDVETSIGRRPAAIGTREDEPPQVSNEVGWPNPVSTDRTRRGVPGDVEAIADGTRGHPAQAPFHAALVGPASKAVPHFSSDGGVHVDEVVGVGDASPVSGLQHRPLCRRSQGRPLLDEIREDATVDREADGQERAPFRTSPGTKRTMLVRDVPPRQGPPCSGLGYHAIDYIKNR